MIIWRNVEKHIAGTESTSSVVLGAPEIFIAMRTKLIPELKEVQTATPAFLEVCMNLQIPHNILGPGTGFVPIMNKESLNEMQKIFFTVEFETYMNYSPDFTAYVREKNKESVQIFTEKIQPLHHQYLLEVQQLTKKYVILNVYENSLLREEVLHVKDKYTKLLQEALQPT